MPMRMRNHKTTWRVSKAAYVHNRQAIRKPVVIDALRRGRQTSMFNFKDVLKSLAETIKSEVIGSGEFTLQDVGKFKVNDKPEMERRNPRTGEMFKSPAKKVVKITPCIINPVFINRVYAIKHRV
jgi:nucleoid DNA-binding protein